MKTKEIIGYNLKHIDFLPAVHQLFKRYNRQIQNERSGCDLRKESIIFKEIEKADLLDIFFEPVYKEEPELELNKWYKDKDKFGCKMIFYVNEINEDKDVIGYGIGGDWDWCECGIWGEADNFTGVPATDAEVEAALIQEARSRGFKEGTTIKGVEDGPKLILPKGGFEYLSDENVLWFGEGYKGWDVMKNGQWAEIIDQSKEETLIIFPKSMEGKLTIKYQ